MYTEEYLYVEDICKIIDLDIAWERLDNSSFLIVGASGMIGTVLIDVLMERNRVKNGNIKIYALGRNQEHAKQRFGVYFENDLFEFIPCDINAELSFDKSVDYVFHCASNTHPKAYAMDPVGTIMTNVLGTNNILTYANEVKVRRTVFLSSVEIYGENVYNIDGFSEDDLGYIDCNTLRAGYPEGKRVGEALCQAFIAKDNLDIVIPRICRVYGPTMLSSDSKALAQFIRNAVEKQNIILKSAGTQYFSYCYVMDVVIALLYILLYGEMGNAYNIADEKSDIYLKDLAQLLANLSGSKVVFECPDETEQKGFSKATRAILNANKLKKLGWTPLYNIKNGLERTLKILG